MSLRSTRGNDFLNGSLLAELDLCSRQDLYGWSGIQLKDRERLPLELTCVNADPQVWLRCPFLSQRVSGTLMELTLSVDHPGRLQVYWNLGAGLSEDHSERFDLSPSREPQRVVVRLPPGTFELRLDPIDVAAQVVLHSIRFYTAEPRGARLFPFPELKCGQESWLELPEVQQALSERLLGPGEGDWPRWLFESYLASPVHSCLHLGCSDPVFGAASVAGGLTHSYVGVGGHQAELEVASPGPHLRFSSLEQSLQQGPFDLILTTGFFSQGSPPGFSWGALARALAPGGVLLLLERTALSAPADLALREKVLQLYRNGMPLGWWLDGAGEAPITSSRPLSEDPLFGAAFEPIEVRPLGGTLIRRFCESVRPEFTTPGASTLLGSLVRSCLIGEEVLVASRKLPSELNLVAAVHKGSAVRPCRPVPSGWLLLAEEPEAELQPMDSARPHLRSVK